MIPIDSPLLNPTDQIFTHECERTGVIRCFAVGAIARLIEKHKPATISAYVESDFCDFILADRGVDLEYTKAFSPEQINKPLISCELEDSILLVDGHHRYVARHNLGLPFYETYILPIDLWPNYLIELPASPAEIKKHFLD